MTLIPIVASLLNSTAQTSEFGCSRGSEEEPIAKDSRELNLHDIDDANSLACAEGQISVIPRVSTTTKFIDRINKMDRITKQFVFAWISC